MRPREVAPRGGLGGPSGDHTSCTPANATRGSTPCNEHPTPRLTCENAYSHVLGVKYGPVPVYFAPVRRHDPVMTKEQHDADNAASPSVVELGPVAPDGTKMRRLDSLLNAREVRRWLHRESVLFGFRPFGEPINWGQEKRRTHSVNDPDAMIRGDGDGCAPAGHFYRYRLADGRQAIVFEQWPAGN